MILRETSILITIILFTTCIAPAISHLTIQNLHSNPILLTKTKDCKLQIGTTKLIHPINLTVIENTIESLASLVFRDHEGINATIDIAKQRIRKIQSRFFSIKPRFQRSKRWDSIGTAWKFIAGSPDAQDLRIINTTINELIEENNLQYKVNSNLNQKIIQITSSINKLTENILLNQITINELEIITIILNLDIISDFLDGIHDAIILSKSSLISDKILSLKEIHTIKMLMQEQGVDIQYPDEALQYVMPKIAISNDQMLYILHIPLLENATSTIMKVYPLINDNQIIYKYPETIVKNHNTLYTTIKPEDFVQRSSFIREFRDSCLTSLIFGKQTTCSSSFENNTFQNLITENAILITNAKNHLLQSNCGPDDRTLHGNFLLTFANCSIVFNNQKFTSNEFVSDPQIIERAFHNLRINWKIRTNYSIKMINSETMINRQKLNFVHLEQKALNFKLWAAFGGMSSFTVLLFILLLLTTCNINFCTTLRIRPQVSPEVETGRFELKEGEVTNATISTDTSKFDKPISTILTPSPGPSLHSSHLHRDRLISSGLPVNSTIPRLVDTLGQQMPGIAR